MKGKNLFITLGLALGLGFGVAAGLSAGKEVKEVKAEAATWSAGKTIYIRNSADGFKSDARLFINYQDGDNGWHQEEFTEDDYVATKGNESLLKVTLSNSCKKLQIHRAKSDLSEDWQWSNSVDVQGDTRNLFVYDSLDKDSGFGALTVGVCHVQLTQPANGTLSVKNHNGDQNGEGYYYSDWELDFSASTVSPYYFNYWTFKSGDSFLPFEGEDKSYNPNTMSNLEGEIHLSAVIGNSATDCDNFQNTFLHMNDSAYDTEDAGLCDKIPEGETKDRYNLAKDAYNALHSASKAYFSSEDAYVNARARLNAWAVAHGESFTINDGVGSLESRVMPSIFSSETNNTIVIVVAISAIAVASLILFVSLKKKKHN